jgi:hypothetical protein
VLEGFPQTLEQAKLMESYNIVPSVVINLNLETDESLLRTSPDPASGQCVTIVQTAFILTVFIGMIHYYTIVQTSFIKDCIYTSNRVQIFYNTLQPYTETY